MKIYRGQIDKDGDAIVTVENDGKTSKLKHIVKHSPTGFSWGYPGSGPSDLSLSMLIDLLDIETAKSLYMTFKERVIGTLDKDSPWVITEEDIRASLSDILPEEQHRNVHGRRNDTTETNRQDIFYCGPAETITSEQHAIELGLFGAWGKNYRQYVMENGKPTACMTLDESDAHEKHLWQYGTNGIVICQCGKELHPY